MFLTCFNTSFKLDRNCKQILGKDLQAGVLPFISLINSLQ